MLLISPPSRRTEAPVIHFAAGDTRYLIRSAISSGFPKRVMPACSGNFLIASSTVRLCAGAQLSKKARRRPVITAPGDMLLTCTPSFIPCSADALASALMAALIAATAAYPGLGAKAALPDMNTTDPFEAFKGL